MDFKTFERIVRARAKRVHVNGIQQWSLGEWMTEFFGESGEAANIIKKLNRIRDGLAGNIDLTEEQLMHMLADELGDAQISLQLVAAAAGISLEVATIRKFNKSSQKLGFPERLFTSKGKRLFFEPDYYPRYVLHVAPEDDPDKTVDIFDNYLQDYILEGLEREQAEEVCVKLNRR